MSRAVRLWLCLTLCGSVAACQRENGADTGKSATPSGSGERLDRMQLSSARRVALQSASEAMNSGDLQRLKQLSVWVRERADVSIFEPDDLEALDLAISCLEQSSAAGSALEHLAALDSGTLRKPARELCSSKQP
jgi:hypothetical protein